MVKQKEIEITIDVDGTTTAEQTGWQGTACHGAIDEILNQIGKKVETKRTRDYYKEEKVRINQHT